MELVLWWKVFVYQLQKLFFNVIDNIVIKRLIESYGFCNFFIGYVLLNIKSFL